MTRTISDDDASVLENSGIDPSDISSTLDDDISPLTTLSKKNLVSGSSPLSSSAFSNRLIDKAESMAPQREDVMAKRSALMDSFKTLMQAQAYHGSAVRDPQAVATAAALLKSNPQSSIAQGLGQSFQDSATVSQALADRKQAAEMAQAGTGNTAAATDLGFLNTDQSGSMDLLKQAALVDRNSETLQLRKELAEMGKNIIVKDSQGNPIGSFNKVTGKVDPLNGGTGDVNVNGTTPGGAPIVKIPGIAPNSPAHAGISQIMADTGIDPNSIGTRTRADISEATKDAVSARNLVDNANKAAQTATRAEKAITDGFPGTAVGGTEAFINAKTGSNFKGGVDYDLLGKYNKEIASSLAASMKNARIGVGMDKFLSGTTFSPGMSQEASLKIISNLKAAPLVAQRNMDLENITNSLPIAAKNAIYSEFLNNNPPYIEDDKGEFSLNPVYKDKDMVKKWLQQRAQGATSPDLSDISPEDAQAELDRRKAAQK